VKTTFLLLLTAFMGQRFPDDKTLARDVSMAVIPKRAAAGKIHGQPYRVEKAEIMIGSQSATDKGKVVDSSPVYMLHLRQGKEFFADKEFVVFFAAKAGDKLDGMAFTVRPMTFSQQMEQRFKKPTPARKSASVVLGVQAVHVSWKPAPKDLPKTDMYMDRFSLRLQFGRSTNGKLPGSINVTVPDKEGSFLSGTFTATLRKPVAAPQP
jgi:hypothetical protein